MEFGAIAPQFKITDWQTDGFTPLVGSGLPINWEQYLPLVEYQNFKWGDSLACDYFSFLNAIEILYKYRTGLERNFSDRWLAKLGGNTRNGSMMQTACDTARKYGLVDESVWPDLGTENWDDYYKTIPQEIINQGQDFLKNWMIYREWVIPTPDKIKTALYDAPLQVYVRYAEGSGILNPVGPYQHFIIIYGMEEYSYWKVFDHYTQTRKRYAWNYDFGAVLKPTLLKRINIMTTFKKDHAYQLVQGNGQKTALYVENVVIREGQSPITGLLIGESIDVLVNSAMRLKTDYILTPKPTTMEEWNSVQHYNLKGDLI